MDLQATTQTLMCTYCIDHIVVFGCVCLCVCVQAVEWLGELLDALLKTHVRLGDDSQETGTMLDKHKKFVDVAQVKDAIAKK